LSLEHRLTRPVSYGNHIQSKNNPSLTFGNKLKGH
jgi:hypothetical protein